MDGRSYERDDFGDADGPADADGSTNSDDGRILGTTTVSQGGRITLLADVVDAFADRGVEITEGDVVVYRLYDGKVVVEPA